MDETVPEERVLNRLPDPYCLESTPWLQSDFSIETRQFSNRKQLMEEWLKISKVIILGDMAAGKTCLVNRYCRNFFESTYKGTIGVDFEMERFRILGVPFVLQIWDTAGQERFKSIAQSYYRGANVVLIVFDLNNYPGFFNCKKWLDEALSANTGSHPFVFLVGTKKDLLSDGSYENIRVDALKLAKELNGEYWAVSSKSGHNVKKLFSRIAAISFDEIITRGFEGASNCIAIGAKLKDDLFSARGKRAQWNTKCCK